MTPGPRSLEIDAEMFAGLISELARQGGGTRESGAFLLANTAADPACFDGGWQKVTAIAYYDTLDPGSLTGNIAFTADGYTALAALCRRDGLQIAADIHTHPGRHVRQSHTDAAHPMVALPGHIALIAPRFAEGTIEISDLGAHHYHGDGQWTSRYGGDVASILRVTEKQAGPARAARPFRRAAVPFRRIRRLLTTRKPRP
jgi:hypothetical protein